ncbi:hypothetical protein K458DRAFT_387953 [Lentithecium fluviatile CBS 122367]|uniref:Uncharacterized protein n=1 Tax=Lentithecium fluviatile CBS 122367 TaxID=1168545 RepID=A0A6G1J4C6_9PLEO|nr:hypothetical protein K458DRAFT_387953 [Lentithecium fluviatile CBS 122367]
MSSGLKLLEEGKDLLRAGMFQFWSSVPADSPQMQQGTELFQKGLQRYQQAINSYQQVMGKYGQTMRVAGADAWQMLGPGLADSELRILLGLLMGPGDGGSRNAVSGNRANTSRVSGSNNIILTSEGRGYADVPIRCGPLETLKSDDSRLKRAYGAAVRRRNDESVGGNETFSMDRGVMEGNSATLPARRGNFQRRV